MPKEATPAARRGREVPRPFKFHWGSGQIFEEASFVGTYVEPAIQLLEYDGNPGVYAIRFCYYSLDGRFQHSPMMLDGPDSVEGMRAALKEGPHPRVLLKKLAN
jgi:hypothetical protein